VPDPENTKMAPTQWLLETWANLKSSGEMDHVWPPKQMLQIATLTVVEQAMYGKTVFCQHHTSWYRGDMWRRMVDMIPVVIASTRGSIGDRRIQGSDSRGRSANERYSGVDRRVRRLARRKCYRVRIHTQVRDGEGPD